MSNYRLTIKTITPTHIGSGKDLEAALDYAVFNNRTYRLNMDAILEANSNHLRSPQGGYLLPGQLLKTIDFENHPEFFRYAALGAPRSGKVIAQLRECIKDIYDQPYLPGSTLKGVVRTALAWSGWKDVKPRLDRAALGPRRERAGQALERSLFGPDPNRDLLRAVQISDFHLAAGQNNRIMIANAQVITRVNNGSPVELEAIPSGQIFEGTFKIDEYLFNSNAEHILHFSNRRAWLDEWLPRLRHHSLKRLEKLARWFEERTQQAEDSSDVMKYYQQLANISLSPNQALVQIGWGTGWDGKTFWTHLQEDKLLFEQIISDYRLQKPGPNSPNRKPGDPFPTSRRVILRQRDLRPAVPLGWVLIELEMA
jgi:CRISPR-associated protein Csm5